jgi:YgiT-type zinc finger domain-containing protein
MSEPCPICSGEIAAGQTTFTVDLGSGVVVVRHVPARVCKQCGEDWIQDPVAERLEKIVLDARTVGKIVEVIDLQAAHHSPYHERSRRGTEFLAVASVACLEPRLPRIQPTDLRSRREHVCRPRELLVEELW